MWSPSQTRNFLWHFLWTILPHSSPVCTYGNFSLPNLTHSCVPTVNDFLAFTDIAVSQQNTCTAVTLNEAIERACHTIIARQSALPFIKIWQNFLVNSTHEQIFTYFVVFICDKCICSKIRHFEIWKMIVYRPPNDIRHRKFITDFLFVLLQWFYYKKPPKINRC